jgi:hypothetical protein
MLAFVWEGVNGRVSQKAGGGNLVGGLHDIWWGHQSGRMTNACATRRQAATQGLSCMTLLLRLAQQDGWLATRHVASLWAESRGRQHSRMHQGWPIDRLWLLTRHIVNGVQTNSVDKAVR